MNGARIAAALLLVILSLAALGWSLAGSPRWELGAAALGLLALAIAALGVLAFRQRERLHDTRRALVRSRLRAAACIDASPDGVVILAGQRIVSANPAFRSLLAIPPDEDIAGRELATLVAETDRMRVAEWVQRRQSGMVEPDRLELTASRVTGLEIPLEATSAVLPSSGGPQLALFLRDLSARRTLELRMRHLARVEALADIADTVAREFQQVFRDVREQARRGAGDDAETAERFERVERLAARGLALVRRVRTLAPGATETSAHRPLDLMHLVREVAADFVRSLPAPLALRLSDDGAERIVISGDPAQVRQAIWQLLENAREAQAEGEIHVRTRALQLDEAAAAARPGSEPGEYGVVEIRDTGAGMDERVRNRAFEPFFTTKGSRGTGLGLTLAYGTARSHGGFAEIDSETDRGTIVRLALPAIDPATMPAAEAPAEKDRRLRWRGRETVLVVDDDGVARDEAREILEAYGYHVEVAPGPREALQRLRQRPSVDLVLLDMVLPGWSGLEVLRRIVRIWPGQRVVMVSPYPLPDQETTARHLGASDTFRKPWKGAELARVVRQAIDRPPAAPVESGRARD
jgi:PAS domain S-box-containing protein